MLPQNPSVSASSEFSQFVASPKTEANYMTAGAGTISIAALATAIVGVGTAFTAADVGKIVKVGVGAAMKFFLITAFTDALNVTVRNVTRVEQGLLTNDSTAIAGAAYSAGYFSRYDRLVRQVTGSTTVWKNQSTGYTIPSAATQPIPGATALPYSPGGVVDTSDPQALAVTHSAAGAGTVAVSVGGVITGVGTALSATDVGKRYYDPITGFEARIQSVASATSAQLATNPGAAIPAGAYAISAVANLVPSDVRHNYVALQDDPNGTDTVFEIGASTNHPAKADGAATLAAGGTLPILGIAPQYLGVRCANYNTSTIIAATTSYVM